MPETDNFNSYTNGNLLSSESADWEAVENDLECTGTEVKADTASNDTNACRRVGTYPADHYAEIEIQGTTQAGLSVGPTVRTTVGTGTTLSGYFLLCGQNSGDKWSLYEMTNGSYSLIRAATGDDVNAGDTARLEVSGTTLEVFRNDVSLYTVTDSTHSGGNPGAATYGRAAGLPRIDNFECTDQVGAGGLPSGSHSLLGVGI